MNALTVHDLKKHFQKNFYSSKQNVLDGISFEVPSGRTTAILGANGAGKTTTIKCLLGFIFPDSGYVDYFGKEALTVEVKKRIGFLPEQPYFYPYLTGEEFLRLNLNLTMNLKAADAKQRVETYLNKVGLKDAKDKKIRFYSKGMMQRIGIAQAILHEPELVILDEPMSGLDPQGRYDIQQLIYEVVKSGHTLLTTSHILEDAQKVADHLVIFKKGKVIYTGSVQSLTQKYSQKYELHYSLNGQLQKLKVEGVSELQKQIDQLRDQKAEILEIQKDSLLEHAFVALNQDVQV